MTLQKIDHDFKNPGLHYDAAPNHQPYIKLLFFFNKLPEVSYEHFYRHFETVHADLTVACKAFRSSKVQRYVQFHQPPEMREKAKEMGLVQVGFDACTEIWVEKWEDWTNFFQSPDYAKVTQPDCKRFMAMPIHVMAGYDNLIFGHAVPGSGGNDGINCETMRSA